MLKSNFAHVMVVNGLRGIRWGWERKGTSTDKITRNDFDNIYERKFRGIDSKSDIMAEVTIRSDDFSEGALTKNRIYKER